MQLRESSIQLPLNLFQFFEQDCVLGLVSDRMNIDVTDLSLFIDDKNGALRKALRSKYTIFQRGQAVRPEIAEQRIRNSSHRFRPCFDNGDVVNANAHNLGIVPVELGSIFLVRRHLDSSNGGEGEGIKRQDNVLLAAEIRKLHLFVEV